MIPLFLKDARLSWDALRPTLLAIVLFLALAMATVAVPARALPFSLPFASLDEALAVLHTLLLLGAIALPAWIAHAVVWGDRTHGASLFAQSLPASPRRRAISKVVAALVAASLPAILTLAIAPVREQAILSARLLLVTGLRPTGSAWLLLAAVASGVIAAPLVRTPWLAALVAHLVAAIGIALAAAACAVGAAVRMALAPLPFDVALFSRASQDAMRDGVVLAAAIVGLGAAVGAAWSMIARKDERTPLRRLGVASAFGAVAVGLWALAPFVAYAVTPFDESHPPLRAWRLAQVDEATLLDAVAALRSRRRSDAPTNPPPAISGDRRSTETTVAEPVAESAAGLASTGHDRRSLGGLGGVDGLVGEASRRVRALPPAERSTNRLAQAMAEVLTVDSGLPLDWLYVFTPFERLPVAIRWVASAPTSEAAEQSPRFELESTPRRPVPTRTTVSHDPRRGWRPHALIVRDELAAAIDEGWLPAADQAAARQAMAAIDRALSEPEERTSDGAEPDGDGAQPNGESALSGGGRGGT